MALWLGLASSPAQVRVWTHHNDRARTGQNLKETILTPSTVNTKHFGALFSQALDGIAVAQPLYIPGLQVNGTLHDVVFVATLHNSVYAFDADNNRGPNAVPLWFRNLGTPVPIDDQGCGSVVGFTEAGIVGTPVIDLNTQTMYVVAKTKESGSYVHRLHALDIATGLEQPGSPVVIQASYNSNGKQVTFKDQHHMQRPALLLSQGVVYISFGNAGCAQFPPSTGWMMAYDATSLQQLAVLDVGPTQDSVPGIWMSGDGPAADSNGFVYVVTGDGKFNFNIGGLDFGSSVLKLSLGGGAFIVADYFTPFNQADLTQQDLDLGSSGLVLLPDQPGQFPHLAVLAGKEGTIYLLNRDNLGQYNPTGDVVVQEVLGQEAFIKGGATYWNNLVYFGARHSQIKAFSLTNGLLSNTPVATTTSSYNTTSLFSISANGNTGGILWGLEKGSDNVSTNLDAFQANTLKLLYSSTQNPARDTLHLSSHFVLPTVADGRIYVGTTDNLVVMGLLSKIKPTSGNNQSGPVNTQLPNALKVKILDIYSGQPVPGVTVNFSDGGAGGSFSNPNPVTNSNGVATTKYTLPPQPGVYKITSSNLNFITGTFTETATAQ